MSEPAVAEKSKSQRTRNRILDAAAATFRARGYAGTTLGAIANAAGTKAGSLYYHFASKEALVEEVLNRGVEGASTRVRRALKALPGNAAPLERLSAAVEAHLSAVLEADDYASANIRILGQVPEAIRRRHLARQRRYGRYWRALLEAAQAAGDIRSDLDLSLLRMQMLGALNWSVEWYRPGGSTPREIAGQFLRVLFDGAGPGDPVRQKT
ncbi:MAG: TetR/AcrR family transcriptional regulator [Proteobacteria bacterium]|nr:TetR/AcrR family transcriptional regulator [Pseudomonadota bacterium]